MATPSALARSRSCPGQASPPPCHDHPCRVTHRTRRRACLRRGGHGARRARAASPCGGMPEGLNIELSHRLAEPERPEPRRERWQDVIELVEVGVLAVVAVATAWSGFQSAKWDGRQALLYGRASSLRFEADAASTQ